MVTPYDATMAYPAVGKKQKRWKQQRKLSSTATLLNITTQANALERVSSDVALGASRIRSHTLKNEDGNVKCPSFYRDDYFASSQRFHDVSLCPTHVRALLDE